MARPLAASARRTPAATPERRATAPAARRIAVPCLLLLGSFRVAAAAPPTPPACAAAPQPSGRRNITVTVPDRVGGAKVDRTLTVAIPWTSSVEKPDHVVGPPEAPRPLVLNWHGCNAHVPVADYHEEISRVSDAAADYGMFAITPIGTPNLKTPLGDSLPDFGWNTMGIPCGKLDVDDYAFFEALLAWASANLCVDLDRARFPASNLERTRDAGSSPRRGRDPPAEHSRRRDAAAPRPVRRISPRRSRGGAATSSPIIRVGVAAAPRSAS